MDEYWVLTTDADTDRKPTGHWTGGHALATEA